MFIHKTIITTAFAALSYSEMASMIPVSGSAYTYAYATMGEVILSLFLVYLLNLFFLYLTAYPLHLIVCRLDNWLGFGS